MGKTEISLFCVGRLPEDWGFIGANTCTPYKTPKTTTDKDNRTVKTFVIISFKKGQSLGLPLFLLKVL